MLNQLFLTPYVKNLVKRLKRSLYLRRFFVYCYRKPNEAQFSQLKGRIGAEGFRIVEALIRR